MSGFFLALLTATMAWLVDGQLPTLPPPPQKVGFGLPGGSPFSQVQPAPDFPNGLQTYCDLTYPEAFKDPSIISSGQPMLSSPRVERLLLDDPSARVYKANLMAAKQAQDARRVQNPARGGGEVPVSFLAPTAKINICNPLRKSIFSVLNDGDTCYTFQEESVDYAECANPTADVPNAFPDIAQWYCVPDSYRDITFMVICPDTPATKDMFRWHTVNVPMNCCGRRYVCDFKPYQSLSGPRLF